MLKNHNKKCQVCGMAAKIAHHLFNFADYPELRLNPNNGMAICGVHHTQFHVKYGRSHNTPNQMVEFIVNLNNHNVGEVNLQIPKVE